VRQTRLRGHGPLPFPFVTHGRLRPLFPPPPKSAGNDKTSRTSNVDFNDEAFCCNPASFSRGAPCTTFTGPCAAKVVRAHLPLVSHDEISISVFWQKEFPRLSPPGTRGENPCRGVFVVGRLPRRCLSPRVIRFSDFSAAREGGFSPKLPVHLAYRESTFCYAAELPETHQRNLARFGRRSFQSWDRRTLPGAQLGGLEVLLRALDMCGGFSFLLLIPELAMEALGSAAILRFFLEGRRIARSPVRRKRTVTPLGFEAARRSLMSDNVLIDVAIDPIRIRSYRSRYTRKHIIACLLSDFLPIAFLFLTNRLGKEIITRSSSIPVFPGGY